MEYQEIADKCPDCGEQLLFISGCSLCPNCGWSACSN